MPALMILAGLGLSRIRLLYAAILLSTLLLVWPTGIWQQYANRTPTHSPVAIVPLIDAQLETGDLIIIDAVPSQIMAYTYYAQHDTPILAWISLLEEPRTPEDLESLARDYDRLIFIWFLWLTPDEQIAQAAWLGNNATRTDEYTFGILRVEYYALDTFRTSSNVD
jgi:hypothetical protein